MSQMCHYLTYAAKLFDHLVREHHQGGRQRQADRLRRRSALNFRNPSCFGNFYPTKVFACWTEPHIASTDTVCMPANLLAALKLYGNWASVLQKQRALL